MRLSQGFCPVTDDWKEYCQHALKLLHEGAKGSLVFDSVKRWWCLSVPGIDSPALFKSSSAFADETAFALSWLYKLLGDGTILAPEADSCMMRGEATPRYLLRAKVVLPTKGLGMVNIAHALILHVDALTDQELEYLRALHRKLDT